MGDILSLAKKLERAMRNGTGFQITADEVAACVESEVANAVMAAKMIKLKAMCAARTDTLRKSDEQTIPQRVAKPSASTKPDAAPKAAEFIKALGVGF